MINKNNEFDWDLYTDGFNGGPHLIKNKSIIGTNNKIKCFSREKYAQELFDKYNNTDTVVVTKDLIKGDYTLITDIYNIQESTIDIELSGGLTITVDLNREKKFIQIFGFDTIKDFTDALKNINYLKSFLDQKLSAYIIESSPSIKLSLWQGYLASVRKEFIEQLSNPSKAYVAKVKEANKGGFFVEVQGIDAFMPGSLAAANKINNFQSYIGEEIIVMIEDYLKDMNSFIVSHKKYIAHILPQKMKELDLTKKYTGTVTGTSKYGIFIEFNELFTGLLHISKMSEETKLLFKKRYYKPNDTIEFYISEITKDKRIILTEEDPVLKLEKIKKFILSIKDSTVKAKVVAVMQFGIIVNIDDITGLIPLKEFKKKKVFINNYIIGDDINVVFKEFKDDKLVFGLSSK